MGYLIAAVIGYLLGCSNMALYISKLKKVDFSKGSGNLGASNATMLMGWSAGILVCLHDIGKAVAAVLIARFLFPEMQFIGAVAGTASVLGHIFPFYLKFKGGKGFAAYVGMTLALNWKLALAVMVMIVLLTLITDYIVVATTATVLIVPAYEAFIRRSWILLLILCIGTVVILFKHRMNYLRICKGTEIGLRSAARGEHRVNG